MKEIDESWRFLKEFFKTDTAISTNVNKILSFTTKSSVCEDDFDVFFEDIMSLIHHNNNNLTTYCDFLYSVIGEQKDVDYLETILLNHVWLQITNKKQLNQENVNDNLSKAYLILKSMGVTLDWALYGGKSECCFDYKNINLLQQGWSNLLISKRKNYFINFLSRLFDEKRLEELYPLTIFFILLRNEYEYSLRGGYLNHKIESLNIYYNHNRSKIYSSVIHGLYNRYEQKDPEIIEWCKTMDSIEMHPLIVKNIITQNEYEQIYDDLYQRENGENGSIKKKRYIDTERYIDTRGTLDEAEQQTRLLLDYAFPYNRIRKNDKFINKVKESIERFNEVGGNETIQNLIECDSNFLINILNQMYLSLKIGDDYKSFCYIPKKDEKELFDDIQIEAIKNENAEYDDKRVLIYRNYLKGNGNFLFIKSKEERDMENSVREAFKHFQHANKDFMTSNKVYDLRQKLALLKEFLQEFSEFKERLTEPINDGDKDKILSILEDYRKYLENSDNGLFDNRAEFKTSIKYLDDIIYEIRLRYDEFDEKESEEFDEKESEEFDKKELDDCLKKIYTNLQNSSIKKMDKLLNLCDIIKDKEEQIKSNLNILCSVDDKGKEKTINLMDFLEKYLDLKSKDIKWAEITREITLIDEKCSFTHNETILKNILNSIIENAYRHGFVGYECAKPTIHFNVIEEKERIVMKICNNGKPINTTTEDYRTNGVFNGATGNTGIGGFQISRWANQYGGDVMVGKSDKWNTEIHLFIKK